MGHKKWPSSAQRAAVFLHRAEAWPSRRRSGNEESSTGRNQRFEIPSGYVKIAIEYGYL